MPTITKRSNFHNELRKRAQSFSIEVGKNDKGGFTAKVRGQEIEADAATESDAVKELKNKVREQFSNKELDIKQKFI